MDIIGNIIVAFLALFGSLYGTYKANNTNQAMIAYRLEQLEKKSKEYIAWYLSLSNVYFASSSRDCHRDIYVLATIQDIHSKRMQADKDNSYKQKAQALEEELQALYSAFVTKCNLAGIQLQ